jgi:sarcosine dehydrogenase
MTKELPRTAKAVVIGGGIIGCSTAYHLGKLGWTDTVLLERTKLTSGTTFHAAGLVGQLRSSANITQLLGYSVDLYKRLEAETGLGTGWKMNGGLRLACNEERWTEVKRQATTAQSFGLDMQLLTPQEAFDLWPLMTIDDLVGAAFLPTDGQANPSDITQALAKGCADGWRFDLRGYRGDRPGDRQGAYSGRDHRAGPDRVRARGRLRRAMGTRAFAARFGVNVPLVSVEHQYIITESFGVPSNLPTLRDPDRLTYYKEEVGGHRHGRLRAEPDCLGEIRHSRRLPLQPARQQFRPFRADHGTGARPRAGAGECRRQAAAERAGELYPRWQLHSRRGAGAFELLRRRRLQRLRHRLGRRCRLALAEWVSKGEPPYDLWPVDIRRFGRPHFDTDWVRTRTLEAYGKHYTLAFPFEEYASGRPCRKSPLYDRLKAQGACFGEKLGWERPNWFAHLFANEEPKDVYSYNRQNWFDAVGREHKAVREAAVIFDQTSFAKFTLKGRDAEAALSWIAANDVARPVGSLVYTQMLNDKGGIECDVTCARMPRTSITSSPAPALPPMTSTGSPAIFPAICMPNWSM